MRTNSALVLAMVLAMGGVVGSGSVALAQDHAAKSATSITIGEGDRRLVWDGSDGGVLVIHLLPSVAGEAAKAYITRAIEQGETLAGVKQAFVTGESAGSIEAALGAIPRAGAMTYVDASGEIAKTRFGEQPKGPGVVVLGPGGTEIFKKASASWEQAPTVASLAKRINDATRTKEQVEGNFEGSTAIEGFDPAAYQLQGKAVRGDEAIQSTYRGVTYRFATAENRRAFNENPEKFVPAYGGWCATAMAEGKKVEIDPKNYKVVNGRLLLFYKGLFGNALTDWNKDEAGLLPKADGKWRELTGKK